MSFLVETISQYAIIIQAITTCVIAWATFIYMRVTARMFEASIEPSVSVDIFGNIENNSLTICNDAGCAITDVEISITVGYSRGKEDYPIRRCIYFRHWPKLPAGEIFKTRSSPIDSKILFEAENDLPEGVKIDQNDLSIDYSFIRNADRRRYCFNYRVGLLKDSKGKRTYVRIGQPTAVPTLKKIILQRMSDDES